MLHKMHEMYGTYGMNKRMSSREEWYDKNASLPQDDATKIKTSKKASGALADGFTKLDAGTDKTSKPRQLSSERNSVGSHWPGPKGRAGAVLHGKASPVTHGDCVYVAPNKEFKAG